MVDPKTQLKRQREETQEEGEDSKRCCKSSLNHILSILEDDEEADSTKFTQDLSPIFTSLQQELSSAPGPDPDQQPGGPVGPTAYSSKDDAGGDDGVSVIRRLLEASDDELGIPSGGGMDAGDNSDEKEMDGGDLTFPFCDGLWEFEDEAAADYYSSLQSQLFM